MAVQRITVAELNINTQAFLKAAETTKKAIDTLVLSQQKLKATGKENTQEFVKNEVQLKKLRSEFNQQKTAIIAMETPYAKLSRTLIIARTNAKNLAVEFGINSRQAKAARVEVNKLDSQLKRVDSSVGQNQRSVGKYSDALKGMASGFLGATALIFGFIRGFKEAFNIVKDFEKSNATLAGVLQINTNEMADLRNEAERLGSTTVKTAKQVTDLQIAFARLGFTQEEIIDLTEATINGSIAMNSELSATATLTGAMVNSFDNLATSDAPEILDIMSLATAKSALNFEKLEKGLPIVAGAANAAGIDFTTLTALLGKLSDSGIDTSTSATALRNIFIESAAQGLSYSEIIEKIKGSQDKLTASNDEFGKRAAVSATVLANNIDATKELDIALQGAAGTAERMAAKELNTLDGSLKLLTSAWQGFILSIESGTGFFGGAVRGLIDFTSSLLGAITPAQDLSTQFFDLQNNINDLESDINPLLTRYDELESKTIKSKDEQTELNKIINQISKDIPSAVTEFDKYGVALGISTEAARAFVDEQKNILKIKNKEAIEDETDAIESLNSKFNTHALSLEKQNGKFVEISFTYTKLGNAIKNVRNLTDDEITSRVNARAAISQEIDTRTAIIAQLEGEKTAKEKLAEVDAATIVPIVPTGGETAEEKAARLKREKKASEEQREQEKKDLATFEQDKIDLLNEIEIKKAETQLEKDTLKAEQKLEKDLLELEELQITEDKKNEQEILINEEHRLELEEIQLNHDTIANEIKAKKDAQDKKDADKKRKEEVKLQKQFNKEDLALDKVVADAKKGVSSALQGALGKILGDGLASRILSIILGAKAEIAAVNISTAASQARNLAAANAVGFPANLGTIPLAITQNIGLGAKAKIATAKIITAAAISAATSAFNEGGQVPHSKSGTITSGTNIPTSMRNSGGDDVLIQAKKGEVILNDELQQRAGGHAFFSSIGVPGFADGGVVDAPSSITAPIQQNSQINDQFDLLAQKINDIKIVAIESDITDAQINQVDIVSGANI